jgi:hypothetical protein
VTAIRRRRALTPSETEDVQCFGGNSFKQIEQVFRPHRKSADSRKLIDDDLIPDDVIQVLTPGVIALTAALLNLFGAKKKIRTFINRSRMRKVVQE